MLPTIAPILVIILFFWASDLIAAQRTANTQPMIIAGTSGHWSSDFRKADGSRRKSGGYGSKDLPLVTSPNTGLQGGALKSFVQPKPSFPTSGLNAGMSTASPSVHHNNNLNVVSWSTISSPPHGLLGQLGVPKTAAHIAALPSTTADNGPPGSFSKKSSATIVSSSSIVPSASTSSEEQGTVGSPLGISGGFQTGGENAGSSKHDSEDNGAKYGPAAILNIAPTATTATKLPARPKLSPGTTRSSNSAPPGSGLDAVRDSTSAGPSTSTAFWPAKHNSSLASPTSHASPSMHPSPGDFRSPSTLMVPATPASTISKLNDQLGDLVNSDRKSVDGTLLPVFTSSERQALTSAAFQSGSDRASPTRTSGNASIMSGPPEGSSKAFSGSNRTSPTPTSENDSFLGVTRPALGHSNADKVPIPTTKPLISSVGGSEILDTGHSTVSTKKNSDSSMAVVYSTTSLTSEFLIEGSGKLEAANTRTVLPGSMSTEDSLDSLSSNDLSAIQTRFSSLAPVSGSSSPSITPLLESTTMPSVNVLNESGGDVAGASARIKPSRFGVSSHSDSGSPTSATSISLATTDAADLSGTGSLTTQTPSIPSTAKALDTMREAEEVISTKTAPNSLPSDTTWVPSSILAEPLTTTADLTTTGTTTSSSSPMPQLPKSILPAGGSQRVPMKAVLIQLGFNGKLPYHFVATAPLSSSQIFLFVPRGLEHALQDAKNKVSMFAIRPYDNSKYTGYVATVALAYIPVDQKNNLRAMLHNPNSRLYKQPNRAVRTLMSMVDPSIPLDVNGVDASPTGNSPTGHSHNRSNSGNDGTSSNGPAGASGSHNARPSSVGISMGAVAGAMAYGAAMFWIARRYRMRRQLHQRLSSNVDVSAPVMTENSLGWDLVKP